MSRGDIGVTCRYCDRPAVREVGRRPVCAGIPCAFRARAGRTLDVVAGPVSANCEVCGKLCHRHESGCSVPPGEIRS